MFLRPKPFRPSPLGKVDADLRYYGYPNNCSAPQTQTRTDTPPVPRPKPWTRLLSAVSKPYLKQLWESAIRNGRSGSELHAPKAGGSCTHLAHKIARPTLELLVLGSPIH